MKRDHLTPERLSGEADDWGWVWPFLLAYAAFWFLVGFVVAKEFFV